jgi:hypothetical protein
LAIAPPEQIRTKPKYCEMIDLFLASQNAYFLSQTKFHVMAIQIARVMAIHEVEIMEVVNIVARIYTPRPLNPTAANVKKLTNFGCV